DGAGAFSHISTVWAGAGSVTASSVYNELYGSQYADGWDPTSATAFEELSGTAEVVNQVNGASVVGSATVTGCEWVAEKIFREMAAPCTSAAGGTVWIYTGAYNSAALPNNVNGGPATWTVMNRAKSRDNTNYNNTFAYHGWGYAWLVNRRVLYNNGEVPGDVADFFMGPDSCSRLFVSTNANVIPYSRWYRTIHRMADVPKNSANAVPSVHVLPGRFPAHTEPYETPYADWEKWGKNSTGTYMNLLPQVGAATLVGAPAQFPLVLTTIRCVEHFQGGPITRNNAWNVEVEPEPWVEIHSADARLYGIKDGDWVNVVTARGDSINQDAISNYTATGSSTDNFNKGFRARVGVGVDSNQRVGRGVVAIPWHWGDAGLSTGSRANDLCIDAGDANTTIPESKACLCKIVKA
ncbi:MAG TPA: molybdopterin dinucleotide binding domain-containing protein, partial [Coriobacteriia bacterium]|nr:molybdopterin dinucleotide binding domain-containing protein [Coriobacteriia bacterium]